MARPKRPAATAARRSRSHLLPPLASRPPGADTAAGAAAAPVVPARVWAVSVVPPAVRSRARAPALDAHRDDTADGFSMAARMRTNSAARHAGLVRIVIVPASPHTT